MRVNKGPGPILLLAFIGVLLLAALAVNLAEDRRSTVYPPETAQGVVQSYLQAISSDQKVLAFSYVSQESSCTQKDMDAALGSAIDRSIIQFAHLKANRGKVGVRLELAIEGVFGGRFTEDLTFSVVRERDGWKLTRRIWPMTSCGSPAQG